MEDQADGVGAEFGGFVGVAGVGDAAEFDLGFHGGYFAFWGCFVLRRRWVISFRLRGKPTA